MQNPTNKGRISQIFPSRPAALIPVAALALLLSACGGGGGGSTSTASNTGTNSGSSSTSTSTAATGIPAGTTQVTPTYAPGSVQAAMFAQVNAYRQTCGFTPIQQNTLLDQAAQNHAQYMVLNGGVVTDTETQGNPGFTGVTGQDSADALGWPSSVYAGRMDAGTVIGSMTPAENGIEALNLWLMGAYHQNGFFDDSANLIGIGFAQGSYLGTPSDSETWQLGGAYSQPIPEGQFLTFPCAGVTNVPYSGPDLESPTPPGITGTHGIPVTLVANWNDVIRLTAASITGPSGSLPVQFLDSSTDPNHELGAYEAVAYPTTAMAPNTTYTVTLNGTINGAAFSKTFTFATNNTAVPAY